MLILKSKKILTVASIVGVVILVIGIGFLVYNYVSRNDTQNVDFVEYPVKLGTLEYTPDDVLQGIENDDERYSKYILESSTARFNAEYEKAFEFASEAYKIESVDIVTRNSDMYSLYDAVKDIDQGIAQQVVDIVGIEIIEEIQSGVDILNKEFNE